MPFDLASLDAPFAALKAYDWGGDAAPFKAIDDAVVAAHGDAALRTDLEKRFALILGAGTSRAAKEYACRKVMMIGTAASVPALAALLGDADNSHMARFALEPIPAPEAAQALRAALGTAQGSLRIGMIESLGGRGDAASVPALARLLAGDPQVAAAAATALGHIRTPEAIAALSAADPLAGAGVGRAVVDARLASAEALLAAGKRAEAQGIYQTLAAAVKGKPGAKGVELAAARGLLACLDTLSAAS
ncbi:MAG: HEAT repeat domain-containing protein [Planctomycetia bacterium]